jgi:hypothetical protein
MVEDQAVVEGIMFFIMVSRDRAKDCFSTRYMFLSQGQGDLYLYLDRSKQTESFCLLAEGRKTCQNRYGESIGKGNYSLNVGTWNTLKQVITLNSIGKNDGSFTVFKDGKQVMYFNQVSWRSNANVSFIGIDFETFFGGATSDWATPIEQYSYFKDFKLRILN